MKYFFIEEKADYNSYKFPYRVYGDLEEGDKTSEIYTSGFLPTRLKKGRFCLARSLRINMAKFELSSENRRILRKNEQLMMKIDDLSDYPYHWSIGKMAKDFYTNRFGKKVFSPQKVKELFRGDFFTHVFVYSHYKCADERDIEDVEYDVSLNRIDCLGDNVGTDDNPEGALGFCLVMMNDDFLHYAYPFYDASESEKCGLNNMGIGMMTKAVEMAMLSHKKYVYLGTCYTSEALYKLQFNGLEFFDGNGWSDDIDYLKKLCNDGLSVEATQAK